MVPRANDKDTNLVGSEAFDGELKGPWRNARGRKVLDIDGDEVGTLEELYVYEDVPAVHLLEVAGASRRFLIPVDAVTAVGEDGVSIEQSKDAVLGSPEFGPKDAPGPEASCAVYDYYGYPDPLALGEG